MDIYLPIAELSVNPFLVIGLGGLVGFLSGLFGVGGGFLITPLLIFIGIPPAVAVGTSAGQLLASSVSGTLAQVRRGNVDMRMGLVLVGGGFFSTAAGVWIFGVLQRLGQIDLVITLCYVLFLGVVGGLMFVESLRAILHVRKAATRGKLHRHYWVHGLPLKMRFQRSRLYISALLPIGLGFAVGILSAIMGVGGGLLMVPAMIYLLGMPTALVVGTSLFQVCFIAGMTTFLQAAQNQTVDIVLAILLIAGGVVGAQFGSRIGTRLRGEQVRLLLAILVLLICGKLAFDLFSPPPDTFSLTAGGS
ncbi:sulfite exporter TauE/SafE family protein [Marinivivus vitaminiproducens]|uniref:sulfite exporter TauE/SafE family protein n=1 Tax=Marinivivus vitaminiproducens TaxID=3035935 RepID=UPI00279942E6|nr:sulfite exporter TauE/SafE family protein [Geminicoccaceae bacterium SCSIO 64248]